MPFVRQRPARALVAVAVSALVLSGCADDEPAAAPASQAPEPSSPPTPSSSPTPSPSPTPSRPDPAELVGTVVYTGAQTRLACGDESPAGIEVLPDAHGLVRCTSQVSKVDLLTGDVLWRVTPSARSDGDAGQTLVTTDQGVYVITATDTPAKGLEAARTTHELTSYDMETGERAWTVPLEQSPPPGAENDDSDSSWKVFDGAGAGGAGSLVVVLGDYVSAFDGLTGKPVWSVPELLPDDAPGSGGEYADAGIAVSRGSDTWAAYEVETGKQLWSKPVPDLGVEEFEAQDGVWSGLGSKGLMRIRLADGQLLDNRLYPQEWEDALVDADVSVAHVDGALEMYATRDLRTPLWSVPSGPVQPLAATRELALVEAESGLVFVDGKTGALRNDLVVPATAGDPQPVDDGLVVFRDGSGLPAVLLLAPPTG